MPPLLSGGQGYVVQWERSLQNHEVTGRGLRPDHLWRRDRLLGGWYKQVPLDGADSWRRAPQRHPGEWEAAAAPSEQSFCRNSLHTAARSMFVLQMYSLTHGNDVGEEEEEQEEATAFWYLHPFFFFFFLSGLNILLYLKQLLMMKLQAWGHFLFLVQRKKREKKKQFCFHLNVQKESKHGSLFIGPSVKAQQFCSKLNFNGSYVLLEAVFCISKDSFHLIFYQCCYGSHLSMRSISHKETLLRLVRAQRLHLFIIYGKMGWITVYLTWKTVRTHRPGNELHTYLMAIFNCWRPSGKSLHSNAEVLL